MRLRIGPGIYARAGLAAIVLVTAAIASAIPAKSKDPGVIKDGALDEITLKAQSLPAGAGVVVALFSTEGANLGTADSKEEKYQNRRDAADFVQKEGPKMLAESILKHLSDGGAFRFAKQQGEDAPAGAIVVEGKFVKIDPGSRAKRYWAGFGAGRNGIGVEGVVKDASGNVLAAFKHERDSGIGIGGGDYVKFLSDDTRDVGEDIAKFLTKWSKSGDLSQD